MDPDHGRVYDRNLERLDDVHVEHEQAVQERFDAVLHGPAGRQLRLHLGVVGHAALRMVG